MLQTIDINDAILHRIEDLAASKGCTVSELVEEVLENAFVEAPDIEKPPPLPVHSMGKPRVCIDDREALYAVIEQD